MKKALLAVCLIFLAVIITACGGGGKSNPPSYPFIPPVPPEQLQNLELSQKIFNLNIGDTDNIIVTLNGEDVTQQVTYTPYDEAIARVENGTITALSQGSTIVTVSLEGANNAVFTVNVDLADLELSKTSYELGLGEEDTITVTCNGTDVTESAVYTLDNNLITVEKGNIKALYKAGETSSIR